MSKYIITHHAYHEDQDLFRLVYAIERQIDPESKDVVHSDHTDIVWDATDPKWKDRSFEDIADEQIDIVKDMLDKKISKQEQAEIKAKKATTVFEDSIGHQL